MWHGVELTASDVTDLYAPLDLASAKHFWDFRGCTTGETVTDGAAGDLMATPKNGATCSADGIVLDGSDDYVDISDWEWGGTTSFEVYVKHDSFTFNNRVFDFGSGEMSENVMLYNDESSSTIGWDVCQGSTFKNIFASNFDSTTWTHVVVTVKGTTMSMYKNGVLVGISNDGHEPKVMTRTNHIIGATDRGGMGRFLDGTIAYLKMWHGLELTAFDVATLYAPHNKEHHFWDFRGCTTGETVTDRIAGDLVATPKNGATCSADGIVFDGSDDYVDIGDWEWGGTTSIEVYVKYDNTADTSRVFDFGNEEDDMVVLQNFNSTIDFAVGQESEVKFLSNPPESTWDSWTHIIVTVKDSTFKLYKNGVLEGTKRNDGWEPRVLKRTQHWLGRSALSSIGYLDGTIAYLKMWHGVELSDSDVDLLYYCPSGTFGYKFKYSPCSVCPRGKFSTYPKTHSCTACDAGLTTPASNEASYRDSISDCSVFCVAGEYLSNAMAEADPCSFCAAGTYSGSSSASCTACPGGTRLENSATSNMAEACPSCEAGKYSSVGSSSCTTCEAGSYQVRSVDYRSDELRRLVYGISRPAPILPYVASLLPT